MGFDVILLWLPHRLLLFSFPGFHQGIMILADVEAKEMLGREILATFGATVGMYLGVVYLEIFKGVENNRFAMGS